MSLDFSTSIHAAGEQHTQRAHDVKMTSYERRCDVITSHRRRYDVILAPNAHWVDTDKNVQSDQSVVIRLRTDRFDFLLLTYESLTFCQIKSKKLYFSKNASALNIYSENIYTTQHAKLTLEMKYYSFIFITFNVHHLNM